MRENTFEYHEPGTFSTSRTGVGVHCHLLRHPHTRYLENIPHDTPPTHFVSLLVVVDLVMVSEFACYPFVKATLDCFHALHVAQHWLSCCCEVSRCTQAQTTRFPLPVCLMPRKALMLLLNGVVSDRKVRLTASYHNNPSPIDSVKIAYCFLDIYHS